MKRAVICVANPWDYISKYENQYSIMVLNPASTAERNRYLLDNADWSVLVTDDNEQYRDGNDYPNEKLFWYTSGTTGDSKFCSFTQAQVDHVANKMIEAYDLTSNDRYVSIMPLWHAHGQMLYWVSQKLNMETTFLPITKLSSLHTYHPTFLSAIPDILKAAMKQNLDSLRFVRSASAALPTQLYTIMKDTFQVPVLESFGMTETCSHCFTNPLHGEQRIGTIGTPSGVEAKIENGHLFVKGIAVAHSGWFDTGDLVEQDTAGYYKILGRVQDRINVRGFKLNPLNLENQIREALPELKELAIFGTDTVKCVYSGPYTDRQIFDELNKLGQYCRPSIVKQLVEIPKNNSGKISRSLLNSIY
jgi:acyl-coenzyme A synthetase/AMP-(fatty) acid ligase